MSKIYRVQDPEGRGPWKPGFSQVWATTADEYATLLKHGYQCVSLAAEIIAMSDIQCVFCRHRPLFKNVVKVRLYA